MSQVIRLEKWKFENLTFLVSFLWNEEPKVSFAEKFRKSNAIFPEISGCLGLASDARAPRLGLASARSSKASVSPRTDWRTPRSRQLMPLSRPVRPRAHPWVHLNVITHINFEVNMVLRQQVGLPVLHYLSHHYYFYLGWNYVHCRIYIFCLCTLLAQAL